MPTSIGKYVLIFEAYQQILGGKFYETKYVPLNAKDIEAAKTEAQEYINKGRQKYYGFSWAKLFLLTEEQIQLDVEEKSRVVSKEELKTLFPHFRRPETDQGYEYGSPLYLDRGDGVVVGYDCKSCGIVLGRPSSLGHMQEIKYGCRLCGAVIYQEDLYGS
mgnify:CR=1 FL=1